MNTIHELIDTTLFHMDWVSSQQGYNFNSLKIAFTYAMIDVEIDHEITPSIERAAYHRLIKAYLHTTNKG